MVASKSTLLSGLAGVAIAASQIDAASVYQTTSLYDQPGCYSQPALVLSSLNPTCFSYPQIASGECVLNSTTSPFKQYEAYQQNCINSSTGMDLTGRVSNYVTVAQYGTSTCSGDAISNTAYVADALCHPGASSGSFMMNCNGGYPILTTCTDSNCKKNCYNTTYGAQNTCNWGGVMATCVNAKKSSNSGSGTSSNLDGDDSTGEGESSAAFANAGSIAGVSSAFAALVLLTFSI